MGAHIDRSSSSKVTVRRTATGTVRLAPTTGPRGPEGPASTVPGPPGGSDEAFAAWVSDTDSQTRAALSDAIGAALSSVLVRTYLTAGATPAQNVTAINTAISDAAAAGLDVCFDGVSCQINGELTIDTPGIRLWASTPAACVLTQTSALTGKGVFRVAANGVTLDGFTLTSTLPVTGGKIDLTGMVGDAHEASAIKVNPGIDGLTVRRIAGDHWFIVLAGFPYPIGQENSAAVGTYQFITNLDVEDMVVDWVWGAVRMSGLDGANYRNVRGRYVAAAGPAQVSSAPPHIFYISMPTLGGDPNNPTTYNRDVKVTDCHATGGRGGAPYSLRYTKGLTWANLTADDCEGLVDMIGVKGFHGTGGHSTRDCYPKDNLWNGNRGSMSLYYCDDGTLDPFTIESADDLDRGSVLYVALCERVTLIEPRAWIDLVTADGALRAAYLSGRDVRVIRPTVESRGASCAIGIQLASGFSDVDSTVFLEDPTTRGAFLRAIEVLPTNTKRTIIYDPDSLAGTNQKIMVLDTVTQAGMPRMVNTRYGNPPTRDARTIAWHHGEKLGNAGSLRLRWPSGHLSNIHTDAWVSTPPFLAANATVTGLMCADFGAVNVDMSCDVKYGAGAGKVGLATRVIDTSNFLEVYLTSTNLILAKRVAGAYTTLATSALTVATPGVWRDMRVRAVGAQIVVYLDGTQVISHTLTGGDETTFGASTTHGLRSDNGGAASGWHGFKIRTA